MRRCVGHNRGALVPFEMFDLELNASRCVTLSLGYDTMPALRHVNKSNIRHRGRGRSPEWRRCMEYERGLARAARQRFDGDPLTQSGLLVMIDLKLGDLRSTTRTTRGKTRAKRNDVDGIKAILDAMNGILWDDDSQIETLVSRIRGREPGEFGDIVTIDVVAPSPTEGEADERKDG